MSPSTLSVTTPVDSTVFATVKISNSAQVQAAVEKAAQVQKQWKRVPIQERVTLGRKFLEILGSRQVELAKELTMQMGRPLRYTPGEIKGTQDRGKYMVDVAEEALKDVEIEDPALAGGKFKRFIRKEPVGVVLIVAPWNYPYLSSLNGVLPSILAGNSVILKHSSQTPLCGERFGQAWAEAGLPEGVFQCIHMSHADTEALVRNPLVNYVNFTGSVEGGHQIQKAASDKFIETTLGPMVKAKAADFVREQTAEAISQGAIAHIDASLFPANKEGTPYLAPQVLTNVTHKMRVMTEETFGPVVGIMKVSSDEEAIQLMNDSDFGLSACIWTSDADAALAIGDQIETGTWFMNRCDYLDPALAWVGVKDSGRGCTLSKFGYDQVTRLKSFHLKLVTA
ncbi:hypothetical protein BGZ94_003203 [Podila epigama]|nr:hypothetical protein BGZ94_003203 [Podila epigama]